MVWVPGGEFWMGTDNPEFPDARPVHLVKLDGFWMEKTVVTNEQFAKFIEETGYVTVAEKPPKKEQFTPEGLAQLPPEMWRDGSRTELQPFSFGFVPPSKGSRLQGEYDWWRPIPGANWRRPEGYGSDIKGRDKHPVVHICWIDAREYCSWKSRKTGKTYRLPTEAEWEFAARGGLDRNNYPWGNELKPGDKWMSNIWQGDFPYENTAADGFKGTSPVDAFPPNGYGLYDMAGNVWQWCSDWYRPDYYKPQKMVNPQGPQDSSDPSEPGIPKRVQRGGSFLCSEQFCSRYVVGSRGKGAIDSGAMHTGFRCTLSAK
jgi:formylglycine-generating enzyme required for sulfatase activity